MSHDQLGASGGGSPRPDSRDFTARVQQHWLAVFKRTLHSGPVLATMHLHPINIIVLGAGVRIIVQIIEPCRYQDGTKSTTKARSRFTGQPPPSVTSPTVTAKSSSDEEVPCLPKPRADAAVVVEVEVLLVTRRARPTKGTWAPPRGSIDRVAREIKESAPEAALRHLLAQTGLQKGDILPVPSSLCVVEKMQKKTRKFPSGIRNTVYYFAYVSHPAAGCLHGSSQVSSRIGFALNRFGYFRRLPPPFPSPLPKPARIEPVVLLATAVCMHSNSLHHLHYSLFCTTFASLFFPFMRGGMSQRTQGPSSHRPRRRCA